MRLFGNKRDIIIVTGSNAVGKTTASNYLRKLATSYNIPYESRIIADSQCLFEAMQYDDNTSGYHHTHDWCANNSKSHNHNLGQSVFPFTVLDNNLPNSMRLHFFTKLTELTETEKLWFVEWAAGVNTNSPNDPISQVDYSYKIVRKMIQERSIPVSWLKRVKTVIHIVANNSVRVTLNEQRSVPPSAEPEAMEKGTAFWLKDDRVLRFYGRDDFSEMEDLFQIANIPIYAFENDGGSNFYKHLEKVADEIFITRIEKVDEIPIPA